MNKLLELLGTADNQRINIFLSFSYVGNPDFSVTINDTVYDNFYKQITHEVGLLDTIKITVKLKNKDYNKDNSSAAVIEVLNIDGFDIVPHWTQTAEYINDHNFTDPTNYICFNGTWTLNIDKPFYIWRHETTGQGWLLAPVA